MTMLIAPQLTGPLGMYDIKHAAMFDGATGMLTRLPTVVGNRRKFTFHTKFKRNKVGVRQTVFSAWTSGSTPTLFEIYFDSNDVLNVYINGATRLQTMQKYRDTTAWQSLTLRVDTDNATAASKLILEIGLSTISAFSVDARATLAGDTSVNAITTHYIGSYAGSLGFTNGGLAFFTLVDGYLHSAADFDAQDTATPNYKAKQPAVTAWGTSGCYLKFENAGNLGLDSSGNGNHWNVVGGVSQVTSTPTNVYSSLSPLHPLSMQMKGGNLIATGGGATEERAYSSLVMQTGIYKAQCYVNSYSGTGNIYIGVIDTEKSNTWDWNVSISINQTGWGYDGSGNYVNYGSPFTTGDILDLIWNADTGNLKIYKNGSGTPMFNVSNAPWIGRLVAFARIDSLVSCVTTWTFDENAWTYAAQDGSKSLCTSNMPAVNGKNINDHFKTVLYTGTRATQVVYTGLSSTDFVWSKRRDGMQHGSMSDVLRGVNSQLDTTAPTAATARTDCVTAFGADTITLGADATDNSFNYHLDKHVAWCASLPSTTIPTGGTITPTGCCYNSTLGMAVITYTGNGVAGATLPHPCGKKPGMIMIKMLNDVRDWMTYHKSIGATGNTWLNLTNATSYDISYWNNTEPTASLITLGTSTAGNGAGYTYVAYVFYETDFCKIGSYVGNGSTEGVLINAGISPIWSLTKCFGTASTNWVIHDSTRYPHNPNNRKLLANSAAAEADDVTVQFDFLSNGFKSRGTNNDINGGGYFYTYVMFGQPTGGRNIPPANAR